MQEFNLIDNSWMPCIDVQGRKLDLGIRDTLARAHQLTEICDDSPLVTVSAHRLLLAILYRAFQGPANKKDWEGLWAAGSFAHNQSISDYICKWHDRFWLFDDRYPFMQVADLDLNEYGTNGKLKKDNTDDVIRLAKEAPDKGGRVLFDHRMRCERTNYQPSQIAKMLLCAQNFSGTGVAKAGSIGALVIAPAACQFAPCVDGMLLWLQGNNLFETLMLNLVPYDPLGADLPAWEDDNIVGTARKSWKSPAVLAGRVQRFTPLSRFVRLVDKSRIFFTNGLKAENDSYDPMKSYTRENASKPWIAKKLSKQRAAWRDAHILFAAAVGGPKPAEAVSFAMDVGARGRFNANIVGMATNQDKAYLWRHERIPIPLAVFADSNLVERLGALLANAEAAAVKLNERTRRISKLFLSPTAEDKGGRQPAKEALDALTDTIDSRPAYWSRLERHFFDLIENLPNDWNAEQSEWKSISQQTATRNWRDNTRREATRALEESIRSFGTTARAIQAIARVRTEFTDDDLMPSKQKAAKAAGVSKK